MTVDDYIDTYKSYANDYEKGRYEMVWSSQQRDYAISRAREYRQLVEWLEELKDLREMRETIESNAECLVRQGRADAIDEIREELVKAEGLGRKGTEAVLIILEKMKEQKMCSNGKPCTHPNCKRCGTTHFVSECDYGKEQKKNE